jgi:hypothetical protein
MRGTAQEWRYGVGRTLRHCSSTPVLLALGAHAAAGPLPATVAGRPEIPDQISRLTLSRSTPEYAHGRFGHPIRVSARAITRQQLAPESTRPLPFDEVAIESL